MWCEHLGNRKCEIPRFVRVRVVSEMVMAMEDVYTLHAGRMVFLRYVILFTALQSLTLAWKMDREVGSDEPTRRGGPGSRVRDSV